MTQTTGRLRLLRVGDVMTKAVITVGESATLHEMALLMRDNGVSALPVIALGGTLSGIVSEADLLLKGVSTIQPSHSRLWPESREDRDARQKSLGVDAAGVMTSPVVTIAPTATLAAAAQCMLEHVLKRLPVVDESGALIGIVSRRDLLTGFTRSDGELRADIADSVLPSWLGIAPGDVTVTVDGGVVTLTGRVDRRSDVVIVEHIVASLEGVVAVDAHLEYQFDDSQVTPSREARIS